MSSEKQHSNPLSVPQRETVGSNTFSKYLYQYQYGLFKAVNEFSEFKQYAVAVECHEDVILIDGLKQPNIQYAFSQVKGSKKAFSLNALIKINKDGSSVLGKILDTCISRLIALGTGIVEINIVSASGFSFSNKEVLNVEDLAEEEIFKLEEALKLEFSDPNFKLPKTINFLCPAMKENGADAYLYKQISEKIFKVYGDVYSKTDQIYRVLMDDLQKKGIKNSENYTGWDDFLNNKTLTSEQIKQVIGSFITNGKDDEDIKDLDDILNSFDFDVLKKRNIRAAYKRYKIETLSRTVKQLDTSNEIKKLLNQSKNMGLPIKNTIELVCSEMSNDTKSTFGNIEENIIAGVIYELFKVN